MVKFATHRRLVVAALLTIALAFVALRAPGGPRPLRVFEPDRMADLELDMWQAYYAHENVRLFGDLLTTLREQYGYSWAQASLGGFYLARAARTFGDTRAGYEQVLPDLERAYAMVKDRSGARFDAAAVARAELNWWVARRVPGENDPENVGRLIAAENALLFDVPLQQVLAASTLRARAGRLRDEGGADADWRLVSQLLHQSYEQLHAAVQR